MSVKDQDLPQGDVPFGTRPALIVVDMSLGFTSPESPLGGNFDAQVSVTKELVEGFYNNGFPVVFSTVVYHNDNVQHVFRSRLPDLNILTPDSEWIKIDPRLPMGQHASLLEKTGPSVFFNTDLNSQLRAQDVDSLMVCGLTTSGCVRASVIDALQFDYPTWVVKDACGDRNLSAHNANLHDMHAKYAYVVSKEDAYEYLST